MNDACISHLRCVQLLLYLLEAKSNFYNYPVPGIRQIITKYTHRETRNLVYKLKKMCLNKVH